MAGLGLGRERGTGQHLVFESEERLGRIDQARPNSAHRLRDPEPSADGGELCPPCRYCVQPLVVQPLVVNRSLQHLPGAVSVEPPRELQPVSPSRGIPVSAVDRLLDGQETSDHCGAAGSAWASTSLGMIAFSTAAISAASRLELKRAVPTKPVANQSPGWGVGR